jgi:hypothetical protein
MYPNERGNFRASRLISFDPFIVFGISDLSIVRFGFHPV